MFENKVVEINCCQNATIIKNKLTNKHQVLQRAGHILVCALEEGRTVTLLFVCCMS